MAFQLRCHQLHPHVHERSLPGLTALALACEHCSSNPPCLCVGEWQIMRATHVYAASDLMQRLHSPCLGCTNLKGMDGDYALPCWISSAFMQVARKALARDPHIILWSVHSVEHLLQNLQQLTDPPLDLNTVMRKSILQRSTPARHVRMAQWLISNLQLSKKELRHCLSRKPEVLTISPVGTPMTRLAQLEMPCPLRLRFWQIRLSPGICFKITHIPCLT